MTLPTSFIAQADLEVAVGGAQVLRDLLDKNKDGFADSDQVAAVLSEGHSDVVSLIEKSIDLTTLTVPYPPILIANEKRICAYYAFLQSTSGLAMPDNIRQQYDHAIEKLKAIGNNDQSLGIIPPPGQSHKLEIVDVNPNISMTPTDNTAPPQDGTRLTLQTLRGFY